MGGGGSVPSDSTSEDVHVQVPPSLRIHPVLMLTWRFLARKSESFSLRLLSGLIQENPPPPTVRPSFQGTAEPERDVGGGRGLAWRPANIWVLRSSEALLCPSEPRLAAAERLHCSVSINIGNKVPSERARVGSFLGRRRESRRGKFHP